MEVLNRGECLYKQLKNYLYLLAAQNAGNPHFKFPTERELIQKFGISRITAKRAYQDLCKEGLLLRYKGKGTFLNPAASLSNFQLPPSSPAGTENQPKKIGLVFPSPYSSHISLILDSIATYFQQRKESVLLFYDSSNNSPEREDQIVQKFVDAKVDGLIVYPSENKKNSKLLLQLALNNFPIVLVDRVLTDYDFNSVTSDNHQALEDAVRYLFERGHRKIAIFSANSKSNSTIPSRIEGYERGMKRCDLPINASFEILSQTEESFESLQARMEALIKTDQITAVISCCLTSSILLMRVFQSLRKQQWERLSEISAIYFELNEFMTEFLTPLPTYIRQQSDRIGLESAKLIANLIDHKQTESSCIRIPCIITEGETAQKI